MGMIIFMKNSTAGSPVSSKLVTPNDLGVKARDEITAVINPLVADAFALFVKAKNFHWHMSGSHYRDYHLMLDEQAAEILAMIDVLAERVRKIGGTTIRSIEHIHALTCIQDDNDTFVDPNEMIKRLMDDNKNLATRMRIAHQVCSDFKDCATTSVLENFIDETERRTWFLYETQVG
jgi:starvation-inducible DNA-binding protein